MSKEWQFNRGRKVKTMSIKITDLTPTPSTLEMTKIQDIYGGVLVVRGWK